MKACNMTTAVENQNRIFKIMYNIYFLTYGYKKPARKNYVAIMWEEMQ